MVSRVGIRNGSAGITLGPVGLMLIIGGIGLLFLPNKIKFK